MMKLYRIFNQTGLALYSELKRILLYYLALLAPFLLFFLFFKHFIIILSNVCVLFHVLVSKYEKKKKRNKFRKVYFVTSKIKFQDIAFHYFDLYAGETTNKFS